jgi:hypothetical protein
MVKLETPVLLGVPEIVPVDEATARPEGSDPAEMLNVYGAVPPVTVTVPL